MSFKLYTVIRVIITRLLRFLFVLANLFWAEFSIFLHFYEHGGFVHGITHTPNKSKQIKTQFDFVFAARPMFFLLL